MVVKMAGSVDVVKARLRANVSAEWMDLYLKAWVLCPLLIDEQSERMSTSRRGVLIVGLVEKRCE